MFRFLAEPEAREVCRRARKLEGGWGFSSFPPPVERGWVRVTQRNRQLSVEGTNICPAGFSQLFGKGRK